jgi:hypothetical protein
MESAKTLERLKACRSYNLALQMLYLGAAVRGCIAWLIPALTSSVSMYRFERSMFHRCSGHKTDRVFRRWT